MAAKTTPPEPTPTEQLIAAMHEQTGWLRAMAIPQVRETIERTLTKSAMRAAFEASDGNRTVRQVAESAGAGKSSVSEWWARWRALGIAVERPGGHVAHLISLKDLGLAIESKEH